MLTVACVSGTALLLAHNYYVAPCSCLSDAVHSQVVPKPLNDDYYLDIFVLYDKDDVSAAYEAYTSERQSSPYPTHMNTTKYYSRAHRAYSYSSHQTVLGLPLSTRMAHNVTHYAVFVPFSCFYLLSEGLFDAFVDIDMVVVNQVIRKFTYRNGTLIEHLYSQVWSWSELDYTKYSSTSLYSFLVSILHAALTFATISAVTSLITRISLMVYTASVILFGTFALTEDKLCRCFTRLNLPPQLLHRLSPWIGVYTSYYARSGRDDGGVLVVFALYMVGVINFYRVFFEFWSNTLFHFGPYTTIQLTSYHVYNQFLEIFIMIFCRSRLTLLYFPKLITILNLCFLVYNESHFYPFTSEALSLLCFLTALLSLLCLRHFECPALDRNPFALSTPSPDNPRLVYVPVAKSECVLGFGLWTSLYSPALRTEFQEEEQRELGEGMEAVMFDFSLGDREGNEGEQVLLPRQNEV